MERIETVKTFTTPIYYVNSKPHIGHLYSNVIADTCARWERVKALCDVGTDSDRRKAVSKMYTGTDEHGIKVHEAALAHNAITTKAHCDVVSASFKQLADMALVKYDRFIRTTDNDHAQTVAAVWHRLVDKDLIYKGKHEGWYSKSDEAFYTDSQVQKDFDDNDRPIHVAIETGKQVEWFTESNYMFRLSLFQDRILNYLKNDGGALYPQSRAQEVVAWLESVALQDLSISRPVGRQVWGLPVPTDPSQLVYVWFEALLNYLTVTGYPHNWSTPSEAQPHGFPIDTHIIGKDIIRFHAVYWPAILMALDLPLPRRIVAHGHWTVEKIKMSKSIGNVVDPVELLQTYGTDAVRYFLMRDGSMADDNDFAEDLLRMRYQSDLADQFGNLLARCLSKALNSRLCMPMLCQEEMTQKDVEMMGLIDALPGAAAQYYDSCEFGKGLAQVFSVVRRMNQYLAQEEPWKLVKVPQNENKVENIMFLALETLRVSCILMQPVMHTKMSEVLDKLAVPENERQLEHARVGAGVSNRSFQPGHKFILFPRLAKTSSITI